MCDKWELYLISKLQYFVNIQKNQNISLYTVNNCKDIIWLNEYVLQNPNVPISSNKKITYHINYNSNVTEEDVEQNDKMFHFGDLSDKKNISLTYIFNHLNERWDFNIISKYKYNDITIDILLKYPHLKWNFDYISLSKNITIDIIKKYPEFRWSHKHFSLNPNVNIETVINNKDIKWNWFLLSKRDDITYDDVLKYPELPWDYNGLSNNPNINWEIVTNNPEKDWNYNGLSLNPNITFDIVSNNPDEKWNYALLSKNPSITWNNIYEHLDKKWNYVNFILYNPNVTIDSFIYIHDLYKNMPDKKTDVIKVLLKRLETLDFTVDKNIFMNNH